MITEIKLLKLDTERLFWHLYNLVILLLKIDIKIY